MSRLQVTVGDVLQMKVAAGILNEQLRTADQRWSATWGLGVEGSQLLSLTTSLLHRADSLE
jgi:hypothetical protein